jgi:hypothetical protein
MVENSNGQRFSIAKALHLATFHLVDGVSSKGLMTKLEK